MTIVAYNYFSISLVLVPALFNLGILGYLYLYLPKNKLTNYFSLFLIALLFWQFGELVMRSDISLEQAIFCDQVIAIGWLAIGPLVVHFACLFAGLKIIHNRSFKVALYFPYLFFFSVYQANPNPNVLYYHEFWGYLLGIRPDSFDMVQRFWLAAMVVIGIAILIVFAFKKDLDPTKKKQTILIVIGLVIPTIQGLVTQLIFPFFGKQDIPVTTAMMTFFPL